MFRKLFTARAPAIIRDIGNFLPHLEKGLPKGAYYVGRGRTRDSYTAFPYRMGAGFSGDVNRTHPFSVEPVRLDSAGTFSFYGQAGTPGANNGIRAVANGDNALTKIYGILVRPFPTQQQSGGMSASFGAGVPPTSGVGDMLRWGYCMVQMNGSPAKGDPAYVWAAAAAGGDLPGQFTTSTTGGDVIGPLTGSSDFNGPPDANGVGEVYLQQ